MKSEIKYIPNVSNLEFRNSWVTQQLQLAYLALENKKPVILDVGAGSSPYKKDSEQTGFSYKSHDFNSYVPSSNELGLQNESWDYSQHDYVCDVLEIPNDFTVDAVLCTEVLEHVPDPVRSFEKISSLLKPGGFVIITVPFLSLMHQAPFWFQSGLSPFWFQHWSKKFNLEIVSLEVQGDYADLMAQEINRIHVSKKSNSAFPLLHKIKARVAKYSAMRLRKGIDKEVLESGGFGTLFVARKLDS